VDAAAPHHAAAAEAGTVAVGHPRLRKHKSNKAENGKGVEGALGPGGLRGRVFVAAPGETEGGTPGPGGPQDRRVPHG